MPDLGIVLTSALLLAVPLVLTAVGGLLHAHSGIINIGLEGQMLIGALIGVVISGWAGSWVVGAAAAALVAGVAGYVMTLAITRLHANMIIVGLGFNVFVAGLIGFILKWELGVSGTLRITGLDRIPRYDLGFLDSIPLVSEIFNGKDVVFWATVFLVPTTVFMLGNTRYGLRLRAAGDSPSAAESLGVNIRRTQESAGFIAGVLSGLGGAYLSLAQVGLFNSQMIAGRGFIALAAFYFGRNHPVPTSLACLLFAVFDALQISLQSGNALGQLLSTLPYFIVVVALALGGYQQTSRARKVASS